MRRLVLLLAFAAALPVFAQNADRPKLEPVPEPPASPPGFLDSPNEPQVTIRKQGEDKVEEYRLNGKLYMVRVTPPHGVPYYLVDERGDGTMTRQQPTDSGLRVPMWVIKTF